MLARRVGRPGLLGLAARTAVVAGTAGAVSGAMRRRQEGEQLEEAQAAQYREERAMAAAPPPYVPAPPPADDLIAQLERLGALKEQGVLTQAEFEAQKARLLG